MQMPKIKKGLRYAKTFLQKSEMVCQSEEIDNNGNDHKINDTQR